MISKRFPNYWTFAWLQWFPSLKRPVIWYVDIFFVVSSNKLLNCGVASDFRCNDVNVIVTMGLIPDKQNCRLRHAPGMFSPLPRVCDPDMHHGTCVTHVLWCMSGLLTSNSLWSRWREKRSRHSRRMQNLQFCVSGTERPMGWTVHGFPYFRNYKAATNSMNNLFFARSVGKISMA